MKDDVPMGIRASRWAGLAATFLVVAAGCAGKDPFGRLPVSGTVTFNGAPLESGSVQFVAGDPGPGPGVRAAAAVVNGRYSIPQEQGLRPGEYRVVISSGDPARMIAAGKGRYRDTVAEERVPPQYNIQTTLRAEVRDGAANTFNYEIP
jgi:hypothetical protein